MIIIQFKQIFPVDLDQPVIQIPWKITDLTRFVCIVGSRHDCCKEKSLWICKLFVHADLIRLQVTESRTRQKNTAKNCWKYKAKSTENLRMKQFVVCCIVCSLAFVDWPRSERCWLMAFLSLSCFLFVAQWLFGIPCAIHIQQVDCWYFGVLVFWIGH